MSLILIVIVSIIVGLLGGSIAHWFISHRSKGHPFNVRTLWPGHMLYLNWLDGAKPGWWRD